MSKGFSLHIGMNHVDTQHYGEIPVLRAAVNDALFWESYAKNQGYETTSMHDNEATSDAVISALEKYAGSMVAGDILLLTYAGHGGELSNDKPAGFDDERNDQTWCLYDRQLLDDELYDCFRKFSEGTRILVVSDSCHSGTIVRALGDVNISDCLSEGMTRSLASRGFKSRKLPRETEEFVAYKHQDTYKKIQDKYKTTHQFDEVKASVKLLAACQDDQETLDGENNGIFTEAFIDILNNPDYSNARCEILIAAVKAKYFFPQPNFFEYGGIIPAFDDAFPFTINIPNAARVDGSRKPDVAGEARPIPAPTQQQWETFELKKSAVLLIEVEGEINGSLTGGKDAVVLKSKKQPGREIYTIELPAVASEHAWSAAHAIQTSLDKAGYQTTVEPVLTVNPAQQERASREGDANNPDYIKEWPPSLQQDTVGIGWHLDEEHSQLGKAQAFILQQKPSARVLVGHLDTGYIEGHVALPPKLNKGFAHSFIDKEDPNQAIDKTDSGQDGHGLGTMTLLAGGLVTKQDTFGDFEGFIGGAPMADIIPMRIAESVVIFNDHNFCDAVAYAIEKGCEVISMSMAGKPSKRMARAVNDAYEAGIVMVTAASNCWYKGTGAILPKCVMFPAAFERVIAATGAMYNHKPYDVNFIQGSRFNITTKYMQGSWGPASRMTRALAAYTPNTPWASTHFAFVRSGGGTSSATPQVAAAAALWIAYHREELEQKGYYQQGNQWKKVEAVRYALYKSAAREEVFSEWEKYYGNGILRAYDALQVGVADESQLEKSPKAESSIFGITELVGAFFKNRHLFRSEGLKPSPDALASELLHLLQTDPQFFRLYSTLDLGDPAAVNAVVNTEEFRQKVIQSPYASNYLKESMTA